MNRHKEKLNYKNIDYYFPLKQKRELFLGLKAEFLRGTLIDVGCGEMPYKEIILENNLNLKQYLGIDIKNEVYQKTIKPDIFWDGNLIPLNSEFADTAICIEVLEHIPKPLNVLIEINRVLKKGGILILTVPFLWNLHDVPNDEYRYTPFSLKGLLIESGYKLVQMESFGGWDASLASFISLYLRRGFNSRLKNLLSWLLIPFIKFLYLRDKRNDKTNFHEGQMITGLWLIAQKV